MKARTFVLSLSMLVGSFSIPSSLPAQEYSYAISLGGSFTASSRLFYNPAAPDFFERNQYLELDNVFGMVFDLRRNMELHGLQLGLSIEYISKSEHFTLQTPQGTVPVEDGFIAFPVEFSGYFIIPIRSETILVYAGGGAGMYFGSRSYRRDGLEAPVVDRDTRFGIHIASGLQYRLSPTLALRTDVKFRDVQFGATNAFRESGTGESSFPSKIEIDGMVVAFGIVILL